MGNPNDDSEADDLDESDVQPNGADESCGDPQNGDAQSKYDSKRSEPDGEFCGIMGYLGKSYRNAFGCGDDEMDCILREWLSQQSRKKLIGMGRSYDAIARDLMWQFDLLIRRPYMAGFRQAEDRRQTYAELSRRYGNNRATVKRWFDGSSNPRFDAFCIVSAAEDCRFPRGHLVALEAYREILHAVQRLIGRSCIVPVSVEDVLCLYLQMRNRAWWQACLDDDEKKHREAAQVIRDIMHTQFRSRKPWRLDEQRALLGTLWFEWSIIESVVKYEWF